MRPTLTLSSLRFLAALVALALGGGPAAGRASAEGAELTGLIAPELVFPSGTNGIERGATLSQLRGKVVWLKFWLRDCPRCRKTLPDAQRLHELYGGSGLVVLTIVQYPPDQVAPFLKQAGYTFRVASDPTGSLAQAYQVNHRPTDYVIGADGRVRTSNGAPLDVLLGELAQARVRELGRLPPGLEGVRPAVEAWDYATAWRTVQRAAAATDASAEVRAFAERFEPLVRAKFLERLQTAQAHWRRKELAEARALYQTLSDGFAGTALEAPAKEALEAFLAGVASPTR